MNNILTFKGKSELSTDSQFLQDCGETLDFVTDGNGHFEFKEPVLTYTAYSTTDPDSDWSNQELADLFRVKRLLNAAGVVCDIDRGLTDEGDPWCVFCDDGGEVFIHFSRIDRFYILDSPSVQKPLRGVDFNALVSDFTNRVVPKAQADASDDRERRVLHFHRNGKVRLHPSALLSALIWTLFLASEELVLVTDAKEPDPSQDDTVGTDDSVGTAAGSDQENLIVDAPHGDAPRDTPQENFQVGSSQALAKDIDTAEKPIDAPVKDVQGQHGLGISVNAYAMGLGTIAIAFGLMSERIWQDDREKLLALLEETDFESLLSDGTIPDPTNALPRQSHDTFLDKLFEAILSDDLFNDLEILRDSVKEALQIAENTSLDANEATDSTANPLAFQKIFVSDTPAFSATHDKSLGTSDMIPELANSRDDARTDGDVKTEGGDAANTSGSQLAGLVLDDGASDALVNIFSSWKPNLYEASFNNTQAYASFDLVNSNGDTAAKLIDFASSTSAERPETFIEMADPTATAINKIQMFDDKAQAFIDVLFSRADSIDMIYTDGDLLLIDLDAFKTEGTHTYTMSWEFSDGSIVKTVGLRADFEAFDLIS